MLTTGAHHDQDLNPGPHSCEPTSYYNVRNALTTTHHITAYGTEMVYNNTL